MEESIKYLLSNAPSLVVIGVMYFVFKHQLLAGRTVHEKLERSNDELTNEVHAVKKQNKELHMEVVMLKEVITDERSKQLAQVADLKIENHSAEQQIAELEDKIEAVKNANSDAENNFKGIHEKVSELKSLTSNLTTRLDQKLRDDNDMVKVMEDRLRKYSAERIRYLETLKDMEEKEIQALSDLSHEGGLKVGH